MLSSLSFSPLKRHPFLDYNFHSGHGRRDKRLSASTAFARAFETREVIDVKWRRVRALLLLLHKSLCGHGLLLLLLRGLLAQELLRHGLLLCELYRLLLRVLKLLLLLLLHGLLLRELLLLLHRLLLFQLLHGLGEMLHGLRN